MHFFFFDNLSFVKPRDTIELYVFCFSRDGYRKFKVLSKLLISVWILPIKLDEWSDNEIDAMIEIGGNDFANAIICGLYLSWIYKTWTKECSKFIW